MNERESKREMQQRMNLYENKEYLLNTKEKKKNAAKIYDEAHLQHQHKLYVHCTRFKTQFILRP